MLKSHVGSRISALNQSREGWNWNSCDIMSSFQVEVMKPLAEAFDVSRTSGASKVGNELPATCTIGTAADAWLFGAVGCTSGFERPSSVSQSRCSRCTYLFLLTRVDIPSVTSCRSWKSRASEVPTTLQNTTKKGQRGYESMVLGVSAWMLLGVEIYGLPC
jgi:hypothetical protein